MSRTTPRQCSGYQRKAARTEVYANGGARANSSGSNSLETQIDSWQAAASGIGNGGLIVLYMGYNDLRGDIAAAEQGYLTGADRLVAGGAAADNRRLFVTLLHDWNRNPRTNGVTRQQVIDWNSFVAGVAKSNDNIIAVDLFTAFNRIYERGDDQRLSADRDPDPAAVLAPGPRGGLSRRCRRLPAVEPDLLRAIDCSL